MASSGRSAVVGSSVKIERAVYKMILGFAFVDQLSNTCMTMLTESLIVLEVGKEKNIEQEKDIRLTPGKSC